MIWALRFELCAVEQQKERKDETENSVHSNYHRACASRIDKVSSEDSQRQQQEQWVGSAESSRCKSKQGINSLVALRGAAWRQ